MSTTPPTCAVSHGSRRAARRPAAMVPADHVSPISPQPTRSSPSSKAHQCNEGGNAHDRAPACLGVNSARRAIPRRSRSRAGTGHAPRGVCVRACDRIDEADPAVTSQVRGGEMSEVRPRRDVIRPLQTRIWHGNAPGPWSRFDRQGHKGLDDLLLRLKWTRVRGYAAEF